MMQIKKKRKEKEKEKEIKNCNEKQLVVVSVWPTVKRLWI